MTTAAASRVRQAVLVDGDLICWNCQDRLIAGYVGLLADAGPVPFFGEMTLVCNKCSCANRSAATPAPRKAGEHSVSPTRTAARPAVVREDNGSGP